MYRPLIGPINIDSRLLADLIPCDDWTNNSVNSEAQAESFAAGVILLSSRFELSQRENHILFVRNTY